MKEEGEMMEVDEEAGSTHSTELTSADEGEEEGATTASEKGSEPAAGAPEAAPPASQLAPTPREEAAVVEISDDEEMDDGEGAPSVGSHSSHQGTITSNQPSVHEEGAVEDPQHPTQEGSQAGEVGQGGIDQRPNEQQLTYQLEQGTLRPEIHFHGNVTINIYTKGPRI